MKKKNYPMFALTSNSCDDLIYNIYVKLFMRFDLVISEKNEVDVFGFWVILKRYHTQSNFYFSADVF